MTRRPTERQSPRHRQDSSWSMAKILDGNVPELTITKDDCETIEQYPRTPWTGHNWIPTFRYHKRTRRTSRQNLYNTNTTPEDDRHGVRDLPGRGPLRMTRTIVRTNLDDKVDSRLSLTPLSFGLNNHIIMIHTLGTVTTIRKYTTDTWVIAPMYS